MLRKSWLLRPNVLKSRQPSLGSIREFRTPKRLDLRTARSNSTNNNYYFTLQDARPFSELLLPPAPRKDRISQPAFSQSVSILPSSAKAFDDISDSDHRLDDKKEAKKSQKEQRRRSNKSRRASKQKSPCSAEQMLQKWYKAQHGVSFKDGHDECVKMIRVVHRTTNGGYRWKAQFTCPITKESFRCGTLKNVEATTIGGDIVYNKLNDAREAAVARALDCFRYREDELSVENRACVEMPYIFGEEAESSILDTHAVVDVQVASDDEVGELSGSDDEASDAISSVSDDDDDDDEEYTIQYLSGTSPNGTSQFAAVNPLARVIGSWGRATTATAPLKNQADPVAPKFTVLPEQELKQLVDNAEAWIAQEQANQQDRLGSAHRVMLQATDFPRSLEIANSMLDGLARAHRRVSFQGKPRGVDQVATKILNHLWSTTSAHPNTNTYVAYLGCLEGPDPLSVASRATEMLNTMKEGAPVDAAGEKILPKRTIEIVNAVIRIRAQVGGESGRFNLDSVSERPNRETFLSMLSSMSHPATIEGETGGFDPVYAQECIDRMKEVAAELSDNSLIPDISVYNAGLRWSGGMQATLSRPHSRPIPWDSHAKIFQNGFKRFDEDSADVQQAYRMNAWLEDVATLEDAVAPNIETYEAVIQAYVRTGTLDGVQQAEMLLEALLDSATASPMPRLQTFHPIIAAWAHSGHDESLQKVNEWIDRLHSSKDCQDFDGQVQEAPLLASANGILRVLEAKDTLGASELEDLVDTALGCSFHLKELCSSLRDTPDSEECRLLDSQLFVLVIQAWGRLGRFLQREGSSEEAKQALTKMYETAEEYESLMLFLHNRARGEIQHLSSNAHKLYSVCFSTLTEAATAPGTSDSDCLLGEHIDSIERWVRRIAEFNAIESNASTCNSERVHGDMYSYLADTSFLSGSCAETGTEFLVLILKSLRDDFQDPSLSGKRGDLIRLCFLIVDVLPSINTEAHPITSLTAAHKEVVQTICHLASGPEEENALLGRLLLHVEDLQEERSDYDAVVKEIRKHSASMPAATRRPSRPRKMRRSEHMFFAPRPSLHHTSHRRPGVYKSAKIETG